MNGDLYFDGKKYISSSRAAKISGYVNDYIGQLCRDGKLEARMVGRSWYVGLESLIQHKNSNLVGTRSRGPKDIKSLLAEVGKPAPNSALKIDQEGPSNSSVVTLPAVVEPAEPAKVVSEIKISKAPLVSFPVFSAPVSFESTEVFPREALDVSKSKTGFTFSIKAGAAMVGIFFAILGFRFGLSLSPVAEQQYAYLWNDVSSSLPASVLGSVGDGVRTKAVALYNSLKNWISGDRQTVFVMTDPVSTKKQTTPSADTRVSPNEGMVVVPVDENTDREAVIAKVKNTFSDEVSVSPTDGDNESGVITPVFKKSKGDDYLYVLVPITN